MKIQRMPEDIVPLLNDLVRRLTALETRPLGTVFINESLIIKDPDTGVETIIGDLHGEGEDRHGIKQWVGDTTPPPIPTSPMVSANLGVFSVAWDGDSKDGIAQAPDFDHINVYGNNGNSTMLVGVIKTKDEVAIVTGAEYNVPWTFWFTSVDFNGNESDKSDDSLPISVTPLVEELDMMEILDDINDRFGGVITEAERLNDVLADAEQTITDTKTSLDNLENVKLPQVEANIEAAHQEILTTGAELDLRLDQAETDLATAETGLNDLKNTELPALKTRLGEAELEIATTGSQLSTRLTQAEQDLDTAETSLNTVKNTTIPALNQRLADAETEINETGQALDTRLNDAFIQIGTVDSKTQANATAASTAQSAADTANSAAASAAGIANGKGKVLVQPTAPVAADRNAVTLWIDTTGGANTPKRWTTGTTWVAVTDKAATDAAQAAATAQSKADLAHTNAGNAQTTANNAMTMAGSKNSVFYSTSAPSGTASLGDTWRRVNAKGDVIGEWRWSASNSWVSQQVTTEMISNLDVGKLTAGTANITDLVVEKLWAEVIRAKKITTDQLLVGSGSNLIVDPYFEDETTKAFRATLSNMSGGYGRNATTNLNWFGGSQTAGTVQTYYFSTINSRTKTDSMIPIVEGSKYRFKFLYNSTGGGARPVASAVRKDGQTALTASGFKINGVSSSGFGGAGSGQIMEAVWEPQASWDYAYFIPGIQWESTVTSAHIYAGASVQNMADGSLIVSGSIDADSINTNSIVAEVAKFIELDVSKLVSTNATINTAVIEKLWTDVIRSRKITTDMLLVGQGENYIADPEFDDEKLNTSRVASGGWSTITNSNWGNGFYTSSTATTDMQLTNSTNGYISVEPDGVYTLSVMANGANQLQAYMQMTYTDGYIASGPSIRSFDGIAGGNPKKVSVSWDFSTIKSPGGHPVKEVSLRIRRTATPSGASNFATNIWSAWFGRLTDASLIVDGTIAAKQIDSLSVTAEVAKFLELDVAKLKVTAGATMNEAVITKLWADVVRSKKITTDQLLVGQGENLIPWDVSSRFTADRTSNFTEYGSTGNKIGVQAGGVADGNHLYLDANWVTSGTGTNTWRIMSDPSASPWGLQGFKVEPEEEFQAQIYVKAGGSYSSGMPSVALVGVWYKADGSYLVTNIGTTKGLTWSWDKREVSLKAPATAAYLHLYVRQDQPGGVRVDLPSLYRKKGASLIVDGSIAAKQIDSESVSAEVAKFIKLDAKNLVVTESSTLNEAVITKLWSDVVMSKKITADMIVVGGTNNVIPNAALTTDTSGWDSGGRNVSNGPDGQPSIWKLGGGNLKSASFDLVAGEKYRFKVKAMAQKAGSRIYIQLTTNSPLSSGYAPYIISNATLTTGWTSFSEVIEIPSGATSGYINVYHNHPNGTSTDGYQWFTDWSLIQMSAGELIVDGAITAGKIDTDAVTSAKIKANSITADKVEVGAIRASHISMGYGRELATNGDGKLKSNVGYEGFGFQNRTTGTPEGNEGYFYSGFGQGTTNFLNGDSLLRVKPDTEYRVTVWVQASAAGSVTYLQPMITGTGSVSPMYPAANKLDVPTTWTKLDGTFRTSAVMDNPGMYFRWFVNHSAGTNTTTRFYFTGFSVTEMVNGTEITPDSITSANIKGDAITAKHTITGALIQTDTAAETGVKLDATGIHAWGPESKTLSITGGRGVDYIGITGYPTTEVDADGNPIAFGDLQEVSNIDNTGAIMGQELSIAGTTSLAGTVVMGSEAFHPNAYGLQSPGDLGPVILGRSLIGTGFQGFVEDHPRVTTQTSWMDTIPFGVVVNTAREDLGLTWDARGGIAHTRNRLGAWFEFEKNRMYSLSYRTPGTTISGSGTGGATSLRYGGVNQNIGAGEGSQVYGSRNYLPAGEITQTSATTYVRCPEDIPEGRRLVAIEQYIYAGRTATTVGTADSARWELVIADMGLNRPSFNGTTLNSSIQGDPDPVKPPVVVKPPPPPDPPIKQYIKTWNASWWATYWVGNGNGVNSGMKSPKVAQGRPPGVGYNQRGAIGFPNMLGSSDLNGVKLENVRKVEVYVYAAHWYSSAGGTLEIGTHGHTSQPSTMSVSLVTNRKSQSLKKPEGRWVTLPSSVHAGLLSGSVRGIQAYTTSTSLSKYGYLDGKRTKIRVTYSK